jgi:hypothetical protein
MASAVVALKDKGYEVTGSNQAVYPPMSTFYRNERLIGVMEVIPNAIWRTSPATPSRAAIPKPSTGHLNPSYAMLSCRESAAEPTQGSANRKTAP